MVKGMTVMSTVNGSSSMDIDDRQENHSYGGEAESPDVEPVEENNTSREVEFSRNRKALDVFVTCCNLTNLAMYHVSARF